MDMRSEGQGGCVSLQQLATVYDETSRRRGRWIEICSCILMTWGEKIVHDVDVRVRPYLEKSIQEGQ